MDIIPIDVDQGQAVLLRGAGEDVDDLERDGETDREID